MKDNSISDASSIDPNQLIKNLINHSIYSIHVNTPDKVKQTPEFNIITILIENPRISIDDIVNKLDTKKMILHLISKLEETGIIIRDEDIINLDKQFIESLQDKEETVTAPPSNSSKKSGAISEEQLEDIDRAIMGSRTRRDKLLSQLSDTSSKEREPDDELESLFDNVLGESLETVLDDFEEIQEEGQETPIVPLVNLLKQHGYDEDEDYGNRSAYQILQTIIQHHPISTEKIEEEVSTDTPLSLSLSNLKADELITQTNDYRWILSRKVLKALKEYIASTKMQLKKRDPDLDLIESHFKNDIPSFVKALFELSYISKKETTLSANIEIPEVEVLNVIREYPDKTTDEIKHLVDKVIPVVVTRMISKLQADGVISRSAEGKWNITPKLHFLMAKEKLKENIPEDKFEELKNKFKG